MGPQADLQWLTGEERSFLLDGRICSDDSTVCSLTVQLVKQQYTVLPLPLRSFQCRLLSVDDGIDRWSKQSMWDNFLRNIEPIDILVCKVPYITRQVLLDALAISRGD